jgi:hypothetical protein
MRCGCFGLRSAKYMTIRQRAKRTASTSVSAGHIATHEHTTVVHDQEAEMRQYAAEFF